MNLELLEHQLQELNGKPISLVRPYRGAQSDSFGGGELATLIEEHGVLFEFQSPFIAIRFAATDVTNIITSSDGRNFIYLKGLDDYQAETCVR